MIVERERKATEEQDNVLAPTVVSRMSRGRDDECMVEKKKKKGQIEGVLFNLSVWLRIKIQVYSVLQPNLFSCMRRGGEEKLNAWLKKNSGL